MALNDQVALSHVATALVFQNQGKGENALATVERALDLDPGNVFALIEKTHILNRLRRHQQAIETANAALLLHPTERTFYDDIAKSHELKDDYVAAEKAYRKSIALQPDAVLAYANLSGVLLRLNRGPEALQMLQQGLQIRPSGILYDGLGNALFRSGDYIGAAKAFEHAVSPESGNPANYLYWANLGDTLLWIPGRRDEARHAYQKARQLLAPRLESDPGEVKWVSRMGLYSARVGDKPATEQLVAKALALAPTNAGVHFRAALAYELLEKREMALSEIVKAIKLGYPVHLIETEPDLTTLRRDPQYQSSIKTGL